MTQKQHRIERQVHPINEHLSYDRNMKFRSTSSKPENTEETSASEPIPFPANGNKAEDCGEEESTFIKTVGWISAGLGAVALGLFIGRELRQRYQFNRRTPYDMYAHSGDEQDVDFGLGI